jgi:hypothetical protein
LKLAEVAAAATVTDAGTVSIALLFDTLTIAPPVGAALLRLTVQVLEALGPRLLGLQASAEMSTGAATEMLPPVADMGMAFPIVDAPKVPLTPIVIELALEASPTVTTATLSFGITFVLSPVATQIYELAPPAQYILLPEDVKAEAGVTEKLVTLAEG